MATATANLNHVRITPRKARIIANLIRGQKVARAIDDLRFLHKSGAKQFFKLLVSAVANAENKGDVNVDNLVVAKVTVDQGPTLKRWRPRAMGRANRILKKTSHIHLVVEEVRS